MMKTSGLYGFLLCAAMSLALGSCVSTYPPGPKAHYRWVPQYTTYDGVIIHGHWNYVGPPQPDRVWIPGHYDRYGKWDKGNWRKIHPRGKGSVWVPGHYGPRGTWIEGYWR
jgi:hypothetical protein